MSFSLPIALTFGFLSSFALTAPEDSNTCPECIKCFHLPCPFPIDPSASSVCGTRQVSYGLWEQIIFPNDCALMDANLCGGGYVPCCYFEE